MFKVIGWSLLAIMAASVAVIAFSEPRARTEQQDAKTKPRSVFLGLLYCIWIFEALMKLGSQW